jgi:hypothetical protein
VWYVHVGICKPGLPGAVFTVYVTVFLFCDIFIPSSAENWPSLSAVRCVVPSFSLSLSLDIAVRVECQHTPGQESWLSVLSVFTCYLLGTRNLLGYSV